MLAVSASPLFEIMCNSPKAIAMDPATGRTIPIRNHSPTAISSICAVPRTTSFENAIRKHPALFILCWACNLNDYTDLFRVEKYSATIFFSTDRNIKSDGTYVRYIWNHRCNDITRSLPDLWRLSVAELQTQWFFPAICDLANRVDLMAPRMVSDRMPPFLMAETITAWAVDHFGTI